LLPTEALITDVQADMTLSFGIGGNVIKNLAIVTSFELLIITKNLEKARVKISEWI
jgi:hypothetical protein